MDADAVVIEYLRGKLKKARAGRAEGILKPKPEASVEMPADEVSPEELAQLEALMGDGATVEVEQEEDDEE